MGMHFGFMVVESAWPSVLHQLEAACGRFEDQGPVSGETWFDPPRGQDVLHVAEANGRTYVFDATMVLSGDADLAVTLSRNLACRVVAAGAETVSGTVWFTAADRGEVRRVHFDVSATLTQPFDLGDPLSSEATSDWRDIDGQGVLAAAEAFGMDTNILTAGATNGRSVLWAADRLPDRGEIQRQIAEHTQRFTSQHADNWLSQITVAARPSGGFDLAATSPTGTQTGRRRGWFRRR